MRVTTERDLIDKGRKILESHLTEIESTPGYLGWRIVETADFLPRRDSEVEVRSLYLLVKIDDEANAKEVASYIEEIEEKAYEEFANLPLIDEMEGRVNIFIFLDFEED